MGVCAASDLLPNLFSFSFFTAEVSGKMFHQLLSTSTVGAEGNRSIDYRADDQCVP